MFSSPILEKGCRFPSPVLGKGSIGSPVHFWESFSIGSHDQYWERVLGSQDLYWEKVLGSKDQYLEKVIF